ncbi:hypothetical protein MSG28_015694 [Choristoneura fumiferana]|uniref:Uncharacterized protein n=1 Tax=Choristoneura fumiferana TaxID=7141 RepID=A0ACC0KB58_CHOFU|nr:hypothetical protein MSG28_015694 [Choristoneura fumiferana]
MIPNLFQRDTTFETTANLTLNVTRFDDTCKFHYPPEVDVYPSNITVIQESKILLNCTYRSNPSALRKVSWYKNGELLSVGPPHYNLGTDSQPSLIISNVTGQDTGNYTCQLFNEVGNGTSHNSISVNILCKFIFNINTFIINAVIVYVTG